MSQEQTYIGLIENNDWEGESFGYYFPNTPENLIALQKFEVFLKTNNCDEWEMDYEEPYTSRELSLISKGADNGYMPRCNIVPTPTKTLKALLLIDNVDALPYKGRFTVNDKKYELFS